jgi:hypothetical protein
LKYFKKALFIAVSLCSSLISGREGNFIVDVLRLVLVLVLLLLLVVVLDVLLLVVLDVVVTGYMYTCTYNGYSMI